MNLFSILRKRFSGHEMDLFAGSIVAFALRVLGAGFAYSFHLLVARQIGATGAGYFYSALGVVTIIGVACRFGLDNTLLRIIASNVTQDNWKAVLATFKMGIMFALTISVIGMVSMLYVTNGVDKIFLDDHARLSTLNAMSIGIVSLTFMSLMSECLKGIKRVRDSVLVSSVIPYGLSLIMVIPFINVFGTIGAAISFVSANAIAGMVGFIMWFSNVPSLKVSSFDHLISWKKTSQLWVMSIVNRGIIPWAPLLILSAWYPQTEVGIFGAASRAVMLMSFILVAVNTVMAPKIAELYTNRELQLLSRIVRRFALYTTLIASPLFICFTLGADIVMSTFGPEFIKGSFALAILAVGQMVNLLTGSVRYLLMMTENENDARNASLVGAVIILCLSFVLIPSLGIVGAALATMFAQASMNIYASLLVYVKLKIKIWRVLG